MRTALSTRPRTLRRVLAGVAGLAMCTALLGVAPYGLGTKAEAGPAPYTFAPPSLVIKPGGPIQHVVILYQENHTFDDVFGELCQTRPTPCNGYVGPVTMADGITAENPAQPNQVPVVDHDPTDQRWGIHNKWDKIAGCRIAPYWCISHVDPANMQNLTKLANKFTVSDATFAAGHAASFGAHVTLGGGTFDGFSGWNPVNSITGVKPRYGFGCQSRKDDLWGPLDDRSYQPSCIPDRKGKGPYRETLVPYTATIMERMEQAGLSWHIYEKSEDPKEPANSIWSVCTYFAWCWLHRYDTNYNSDPRDFIDEAAAGTLPNLSILIPTIGVSQHNLTLMDLGDNYIGRIVGAVEKSPDWDSTAIFITYDDCGCFYDHVAPPSKKYGLRNPMVIISPYAIPGGTDSNVAIQPYSMLAFTEHVFGLAPLTQEVSSAYDYAGSFDFNQKPVKGDLQMTVKPIPKSEIQRVSAFYPQVAQDDT